MRTAILMIVALASGCASLGASRDPLCQEILRFANAVEPGQAARVRLCVDWGPRCAGEPDSIMSKECQPGGEGPASRLCNYLAEHSSAESPGNNFGSALACLGKDLYKPERYGDYTWDTARVRTDAMPGLEQGVEIGIEYVRASDASPASLAIDAKAERPPFPDDVVMARLRREAGPVATIRSNGRCSDVAREQPLSDPEFRSTFPDGAWLLCDATATRAEASAILFHYLFHASLERPMVAGRIDVGLARHDARWRITRWVETAVDYAP